MAAVVFNPAAFKAAYPEFGAVLDATLNAYFLRSQLFLVNEDCPVQDEAKRLQLYWLLVAHIAQLSGALNPGGVPGPVGRTSSATEGSVSVSLEYHASMGASWFTQTSYGAAFWQATAYLRSFRYVARLTRY
ncbi:virion structural protein [Aeromonas phage 4_D05]|uniref:DUF4054 domain-containing protein n=2 Tax=Kunmingvirus TaxID=2948791 RepID=A0A4Y5TWV5_9CAUD|nr:virion structural protein [Aeromonas phage 2_D05]YP_010053024.1 virion structural protein [Aeromonas phage 4_D05]QDB73893.1 hypothetical protein 2D05_062 [Aeromonas phage 2_D05]QDJ96167.1 hypothetical protein 4D05_054 [Aeromonas phage 4_D05]